jgi:outer membrane protein TolC
VNEVDQPSGADRLALEALRSRAEITAARLHARAESLKEDSARREYYPTITLSTSYSSMWDMPEHRWMVGVGVNLPIPSERRAGAIDEARATRAQYESEAARMSASVRAEVYIALRNLEESTQLLELFRRRLLPLARDRVEATQASFSASKAPFASIIDAQKNLRSVELDHEMAQAEYERRRAEIDRVLGRIPGLHGAGGEP